MSAIPSTFHGTAGAASSAVPFTTKPDSTVMSPRVSGNGTGVSAYLAARRAAYTYRYGKSNPALRPAVPETEVPDRAVGARATR